MRNMIVALCVGAVAVSLAGCPPKTVNSVDVNASGGYNWVMTDPLLGDYCRVISASKRFEGDMLRCNIEVQNLRDQQLNFQYQFVWYDQDGMPIHNPFTWSTEFIEAGQTKRINGVAPDPRARSCKLELKRIQR